MNILYLVTGLITLGLVCLSRFGSCKTGVVRMNIYSLIQIVLFMVILLALAKPLGSYMAKVYQGERTFLDRIVEPIERFIYRISGIDPKEEMDWKVYAIAMLTFNVLGLFFVYALQRLQGIFCHSTRRDLEPCPLILRGIRRSVLRPTPTGRDTAAR